jgi:Type II CAAX prenyl endopeptidase Rce1-like
MTVLLLKLACVTAAVFGYYYFYLHGLLRFAHTLSKRIAARTHRTFSEVTGIVELSLCATSHVVFCTALLFAMGVTPRALMMHPVGPVTVLFGILLGIAEMGLASFLCRLAIETTKLAMPEKVPRDLTNWLTIAKGGWMRHHLRTLEVAPWPLIAVLLVLQISSEEIVFRGVVANVASAGGAVAAVAASALLFSIIQGFQMPSWQSAMFPIIGGVVMGIVHGMLYMAVPNIAPLVVAHLAFFAFAIK